MSARFSTPVLAVGVAFASFLTSFASAQSDSTSWTISADVVHTVSGAAIEGGLITVKDGAITSVGPGSGGTLQVAAVTPGMIDLSARMTLDFESVEQSYEVTPAFRVADAIDVFALAWKRHAQSGVSTVLINPYDRNVIGGYGVAMKTAGAQTVGGLTVKADAVMRATMGSTPSFGNRASGRPDSFDDFYQRRPTTRMGVEWLLRKAFYDAHYAEAGVDEAFDGSADLGRVLKGELPFFVQAWTTQDIRTAVFLKEEAEREGLGKPRFLLDSAAEAWREPKLLVRSGIGVVLPPLPAEGRTGERSFMALDTAKTLLDLDVPVALSAHGQTRTGVRLDRQAGFAMRGGLSRAQALRAVTLTPAEMVGVDDRVGSIDVGKDADLVLWSGPPFELTSRVVGVLIDGQLILDPRPAEAAGE